MVYQHPLLRKSKKKKHPEWGVLKKIGKKIPHDAARGEQKNEFGYCIRIDSKQPVTVDVPPDAFPRVPEKLPLTKAELEISFSWTVFDGKVVCLNLMNLHTH